MINNQQNKEIKKMHLDAIKYLAKSKLDKTLVNESIEIFMKTIEACDKENKYDL